MIERYGKAYRIIFIICAVLVIIGGVMQLLHIEFGISGRSLTVLTLLFISGYQSWFITKLCNHLKDKEDKQ